MGQRWAVVGGGILGITVAHRLARLGRDVTLFEADPELGGLAGSRDIDGIRWDRYYHVTLLSDRRTRALLGEAGVETEYRWALTRTGVLADGRLHSVSNAMEYLKFPVLGPVDKARLAATILYASSLSDWETLERVRVADWLIALSGRTTFERFWLPLLRSKLGDAWTDTSAAFLWATIQRLYAARRAGLAEERFGYLPGGWARGLAALTRMLRTEGVAIETGWPVGRVVPVGESRVEVELRGGPAARFDGVVVTVPGPVAADLCPALSDGERYRLGRPRYLGVLCASVLLTRPLGGFYVTNLLDPALPFTGIIEMSALVDRAEFGGRHLVYLPRYVASDDSWLTAAEDRVRRVFLNGLRRVYPDLSDDNIVGFCVSRSRYVMPVPALYASKGTVPIRTSVPGLFVANSALIVAGTQNVNETIGLADRVAAEVG